MFVVFNVSCMLAIFSSLRSIAVLGFVCCFWYNLISISTHAFAIKDAQTSRFVRSDNNNSKIAFFSKTLESYRAEMIFVFLFSIAANVTVCQNIKSHDHIIFELVDFVLISWNIYFLTQKDTVYEKSQ